MQPQLTIVHCDNHLDTLGVDLFALLVPVNDGLGIATGLAHKWCHAPWHSDLVWGNLGELGGGWEGESRRETQGGGEKRGGGKSTNMKIDTLTPRGHQTDSTSSNNPPLTTPHFTVSDWAADSDGGELCLLPGYHLEDMLKDFLWVINKRCGWASQELSLSSSPPPSSAG